MDMFECKFLVKVIRLFSRYLDRLHFGSINACMPHVLQKVKVKTNLTIEGQSAINIIGDSVLMYSYRNLSILIVSQVPLFMGFIQFNVLCSKLFTEL